MKTGFLIVASLFVASCGGGGGGGGHTSMPVTPKPSQPAPSKPSPPKKPTRPGTPLPPKPPLPVPPTPDSSDRALFDHSLVGKQTKVMGLVKSTNALGGRIQGASVVSLSLGRGGGGVLAVRTPTEDRYAVVGQGGREVTPPTGIYRGDMTLSYKQASQSQWARASSEMYMRLDTQSGKVSVDGTARNASDSISVRGTGSYSNGRISSNALDISLTQARLQAQPIHAGGDMRGMVSTTTDGSAVFGTFNSREGSDLSVKGMMGLKYDPYIN